ncbi:hypothetical protein SprV_0100303800 [Sparganum proliferum]
MVHDLSFADDRALNTTTKADMRRSLDLFTAGCVNCGLTINTDEKVATHQPPPDAAHNASRIQVNGTQLKTVNISHVQAAHSPAALKSTTKWTARSPKSVRPSASCRAPHKVVTVSTLIQSSRRDDAAVWCGDLDSTQQARKFNHFHPSCRRRIQKLGWQDRIPETEVL